MFIVAFGGDWAGLVITGTVVVIVTAIIRLTRRDQTCGR